MVRRNDAAMKYIAGINKSSNSTNRLIDCVLLLKYFTNHTYTSFPNCIVYSICNKNFLLMNAISILLIDDNHDYRSTMKDFLEQHAIRVAGSFSHQSFLKSMPKLQANIALIGFKTAWSFTWRTIAYVRQYYPDLKIILCTAPNDPLPFGNLEDAGINGLFNKVEDDANDILQMLQVIKCLIVE